MKPIKFTIFGYYIYITKEHPLKLHITDYISNTEEIVPWEHSFPMNKRIEAMVGHHRFIEYIFRDMDFTLISYRDSALILLEDAMKSLSKIRTKLALKGATDTDLNKFDTKIRVCFEKTMRVVGDRIEDPLNPNKEADKELLIVLESFKIYEYHK